MNQKLDSNKTKIKFKTGMDYIKDILHIRNRLLYISKNYKPYDNTARNLISSSIVNASRIQQLTQDKETQRQTIEQLRKQNTILQQAIYNVEQQLNNIIDNLSSKPQQDTTETPNAESNTSHKIDHSHNKSKQLYSNPKQSSVKKLTHDFINQNLQNTITNLTTLTKNKEN